ncbi:MAG: dihydroorotate dehydrogenase electron transfer subunit [bacterium]|nr:dihydroorotate dehydrogenase electron transfer subunit [Candidatus Sumerlaeota bacterium]
MNAVLAGVEQLDADTFAHVYRAPEIARDARPGQFLHIRVSSQTTPLLRRPISILWSDGAVHVQTLFKVVRSGTALLAEKREGGLVDIAGPLGNPFPAHDDLDAVMIAGGYGISPLFFLGGMLNPDDGRFVMARPRRRTLLYGARTAEGLYLRDRLADKFDEVIYATEDGSLGARGPITGVLGAVLSERSNIALYACGPTPMLAAIINQIGFHKTHSRTPCWLSMENQMGCGVGACLGCVVKTRDGFRTTCKDGPVFAARDLIL